MKHALLTALAAFSLTGLAHAGDLQEIKESGKLRVAVANLSPFVIADGEGGFTGFEIESMTALAEHLGVTIEYVEKPFCDLVDAVIEGEADMIASGFSNTPRRRNILDFSLPYHDTEYVVVVRKDKSKRAKKSLRSLNSKTMSIGYQEGGVSSDVAKGDFSGADLKDFSSFAEIVDALKAGDLDGAVMFSPYEELMIRNKDPKFVVPHDFALTRTIEAFAVDKGNEALRDELNAWVIARDLDGYWDELEDKWFDPDNVQVGARPPYECPSKIPAG